MAARSRSSASLSIVACLIVCLPAAVVLSGCAGNADAKRLAAALSDETTKVRGDVIKLKNRDAQLAAVASQLAAFGNSAAGSPIAASSYCNYRYAQARAKLFSAQAQLAQMITTQTNATLKTVDSAINDALTKRGIDTRQGALVAQLKATQSALIANPSAENADKRDKIEQRIAVLGVGILMNVNLVRKAGVDDIVAISNKASASLASATQTKLNELSTLHDACQGKRAAVAPRAQLPEKIVASPEAYDALLSYLDAVHDAGNAWSEQLQANSLGPGSFWREFLQKTRDGLVAGALKINNTAPSTTTELTSSLQDAVSATTGVNPSVVGSWFSGSGINLNGLKSAAGLDNLGQKFRDSVKNILANLATQLTSTQTSSSATETGAQP